jgi:hypothetical protein
MVRIFGNKSDIKKYNTRIDREVNSFPFRKSFFGFRQLRRNQYRYSSGFCDKLSSRSGKFERSFDEETSGSRMNGGFRR